MRAADHARAAQALRRLLAAVEAGTIVAGPGTVHRLEGAAMALEQVAGSTCPASR